jgi:hypothetical protein
MATYTDLVLIEIDDQDVLTCHLAYDSLPQVRYRVRTPGATELVIVDRAGRVDNLTYEFTADHIRVEFLKRSDYYAVLHRRRNFVTVQGDQWTYNDHWPATAQHYFAWFFPRGSRVVTLAPDQLLPQLARWNEQPVLEQHSATPTITATYSKAAATAPALPRRESFELDRLLCDLAPPHGTEAEVLCRHLTQLPDLDSFLGGATALRALLAQKLDLNLNAPGTRSLVG